MRRRKSKGRKRKQTEGSTHKDGKIRQTGWSSIQFQACETKIIDPASFNERCYGMALTPISPLAQSDMIWVSLVFTILPFVCMEQAQMRLSASICAAMNAWSRPARATFALKGSSLDLTGWRTSDSVHALSLFASNSPTTLAVASTISSCSWECILCWSSSSVSPARHSISLVMMGWPLSTLAIT